jgi:hypothetical protein
MRRHHEAVLPLLTTAAAYDEVVEAVRAALHHHGFAVEKTQPGFWMRMPTAAMLTLAGRAMRGYVPENLAYLAAADLAVAIYPNSILLRGPLSTIAKAQGVIAETLSQTSSYQTAEPAAQDLERQIKRVWKVLDENPAEHTNSTWLIGRVDEITEEFLKLEVSYDEWQTLYRQLLQLSRALHGEPQLLGEKGDSEMQNPTTQNRVVPNGSLQEVPTASLMAEIASKVTLLVNKEVELARTELKRDLRAELAAATRIGVGAVAGLATLNLLLLAAVFALAPYLGEMMAALALAALTLLVAVAAGALGWAKVVTSPLVRTRRTLRKDLQWTKEKMA